MKPLASIPHGGALRRLSIMQLHVPPADHVNNHPYCLHLWRPHDFPIPRPPAFMVGVKDLGVLTR